MALRQSRRNFLKASAAVAGASAAAAHFGVPAVKASGGRSGARATRDARAAAGIPPAYPLDVLRPRLVDQYKQQGRAEDAQFVEVNCLAAIVTYIRNTEDLDQQTSTFGQYLQPFPNGQDFAAALLVANNIDWDAPRFPADTAALVAAYQAAEGRPALPVVDIKPGEVNSLTVQPLRPDNREVLQLAAAVGREDWAKAARDILAAAVEDAVAIGAQKLPVDVQGRRLLRARMSSVAGAAGARIACQDLITANGFWSLLRLMAAGYLPLGETPTAFAVTKL